MTPVLEAKNLAKTYETGGAKVLGLRGVDISIERGEFVAIMGPSEEVVIAPWWSLALIPVGTVLVVVAATVLPARLATRIRTADALRYE